MKQVFQSITHLIVVVVVTLALAVSTAALTQWASADETPDGRQTAEREASLVSVADGQTSDGN